MSDNYCTVEQVTVNPWQTIKYDCSKRNRVLEGDQDRKGGKCTVSIKGEGMVGRWNLILGSYVL